MINRSAGLALLAAAATACAATVSGTQVSSADAAGSMIDASALDLPTHDASEAAVGDSPPGEDTPRPLDRLAIGVGIGRLVRRDGQVILWGEQAELFDGVPSSAIDGLPREALGRGTDRSLVGLWSYCYIARSVSGGLFCWGRNDLGQLGNGSTSPSVEPVAVIGVGSVTEVVSSGLAWCVLSDGSVRCWGHFSLGHGEPGSSPVPISIPAPIVRIFGGTNAGHFLGLDANGSLWCWGNNLSSACGVGPPVIYPNAVRVPPVPTVRSVAIEEGYSCVLSTDGNVRCWGWVPAGLTGGWDGGEPRTLLTPTIAPAYAGATAISAGFGFLCAIQPTGRVVCGGSPTFQLTLGYRPRGPSPFPPHEVPGVENVIELRTAANHSCALTSSDDVYCWGFDMPRQLGIVNQYSHSPPRRLIYP